MSSVIEFNCPHCERVIRTSAQYAGMQGPCPHCAKPVKVIAPAGAETAIFRPPAPPPMQGATDANPLFAGLLGTVATVALFGMFFGMRGTYLGDLFTERGPVQFISTFVVCWGLAMLALKYWAVKQQLGYVGKELELLPLESGVQISPKNVDTFLHHLDSLPEEARESILGHRIRGALEHFRARGDVPEVQAYLSSQANIDASGVDSGYTLLRCFIWVIPILGFIGTVTGISDAVTGLAQSLKSAAPAQVSSAGAPGEAASAAAVEEGPSLGSQMIQGMGLVTQGLATAFDTTFVGLVFAALLLFPTETLKRIEYGMLDRIEAFTQDTLLRRLADETPRDALSPEMARLLEPAYKKHQQWLLEWQAKVAELGNTIGRDFEKHLSAAQQRLEGLQSTKSNEVVESVRSLDGSLSSAVAYVQQLKEASQTITADLKATILAAAELQHLLSQNTGALAQLCEQWTARPLTPNGNGDDHLAEAIGALHGAAERFNQAALQGNATPRRGWFR